jgi:hypothetical protein
VVALGPDKRSIGILMIIGLYLFIVLSMLCYML